MADPSVRALLILLAIIGAVALVTRLILSAVRWLLRSAELTAASSSVELSARRGDLTALAEARAAEVHARGARIRAGLNFFLWFLLLAIPFATGVLGAYALAAPLWLLGRRG